MLGRYAKLTGVVLIAPVYLAAAIAAHAALGPRGIYHAKTSELQHRARAAKRQRLRPFRMPLQRQPVGHPVAVRSAARRRAIVKILNTVVTPQAAQRHGAVA